MALGQPHVPERLVIAVPVSCCVARKSISRNPCSEKLMLRTALRRARLRSHSVVSRTAAPSASPEISSFNALCNSQNKSSQELNGWSCLQRASFAKASKKNKDASYAAAVPSFDASEANSEMSRAVEYLEQELASVRTGRASPGLLDNLKIEVYGQRMPLKAAASISVRDSQTLLVTAFDPSTMPAVEKAIRSSALNLNPRAEGQELVVPISRATKDTLAAMGKLIGQAGEAAKVKVRQARKSAVDLSKDLSSEDDQKRAEKQVQTMTNKFVTSIERICIAKEKELQVL